MIYLSKGILQNSNKDNIHIIRGNDSITLSGSEAKLWLGGNQEFTHTKSVEDTPVILKLSKLGLVEYEDFDTPINKYRILSRCVCCETRHSIFDFIANRAERKIMRWIKKAGIRLSTAELIYLFEKGINPSRHLLYPHNRQALVEKIYMTNNIFDNILENQMEKAHCRDQVVDILTRLIYKQRLVVL